MGCFQSDFFLMIEEDGVVAFFSNSPGAPQERLFWRQTESYGIGREEKHGLIWKNRVFRG